MIKIKEEQKQESKKEWRNRKDGRDKKIGQNTKGRPKAAHTSDFYKQTLGSGHSKL